MGGLIEAVLCGVHSMAKLPGGDDGLRGVVINTASIAAFEGQIGQVCRRPVNLTRILRAFKRHMRQMVFNVCQYLPVWVM